MEKGVENVDNPWEQWKPEWSITDLVISTALHRGLPKMNGVPERAGKRDAGYPAKPGMGEFTYSRAQIARAV